MTRYNIVPERSRAWVEGRSSLHAIRYSADGLVGFIDHACATPTLVGCQKSITSRDPVVFVHQSAEYITTHDLSEASPSLT